MPDVQSPGSAVRSAGMETKSNINVQISRVDSRTDVGQFAQLAYALGYDMELAHEVVRDRPRRALWLRRQYLAPITEDLPRLVYLAAMGSGRSIDSVMDDMRRHFTEWHVQTDAPLADVPGIGEMHYGGHNDEQE